MFGGFFIVYLCSKVLHGLYQPLPKTNYNNNNIIIIFKIYIALIRLSAWRFTTISTVRILSINIMFKTYSIERRQLLKEGLIKKISFQFIFKNGHTW